MSKILPIDYVIYVSICATLSYFLFKYWYPGKTKQNILRATTVFLGAIMLYLYCSIIYYL